MYTCIWKVYKETLNRDVLVSLLRLHFTVVWPWIRTVTSKRFQMEVPPQTIHENCKGKNLSSLVRYMYKCMLLSMQCIMPQQYCCEYGPVALNSIKVFWVELSWVLVELPRQDNFNKRSNIRFGEEIYISKNEIRSLSLALTYHNIMLSSLSWKTSACFLLCQEIIDL